MKTWLLSLAVFVSLINDACAAGLDVAVATEGLTVRITGPESLITRAGGFPDGVPYAGCLYGVEWGDGQQTPGKGEMLNPPYCSSDLRHTYAQPGQYTIRAMTYDAGPTDGMENVQNGEMTVSVH
jgi:hypothetical protein